MNVDIRIILDSNFIIVLLYDSGYERGLNLMGTLMINDLECFIQTILLPICLDIESELYKGIRLMQEKYCR